MLWDLLIFGAGWFAHSKKDQLVAISKKFYTKLSKSLDELSK